MNKKIVGVSAVLGAVAGVIGYKVGKRNQDTDKNEDLSETPLVSVIMATYNDKPEYIKQSLESVVNQTYRNIEILIIDDSTDEESKMALDSYAKDPRVRIYREEEKLGFVASLNKGLSLATGDLVARMDVDDIADLHRFVKQVKYLQVYPFTDILGGQIDIVDENGNKTGHRSYPLGGLKLIAFFTMRTPVAHPTVMFRRKIVDEGHRYDESFKKAEDIDFWIRMYNEGYRFSNLPDTIVDFRVESGFMEKRVTNHDQENYVLKARRKNFTWRRPFFSVADLTMSYVRKLTPDRLKAVTYRKENGVT